VSRRLARAALAVYPLAFRRRYGAEMRALLDESTPSALSVLDLLRGALGAHLRPPVGLRAALAPEERVRASVSAVLACWVAFALAGFGFYKTTEDAPATAAGKAHPLLGDAHLLVQVLAVVGSAAVVIGALPLIAGALSRARREPRLRRLVAVPPLAVGCFAVLTALLVSLARVQHGDHASSVARGAFVAWLAGGLVCAGVCVVYARRTFFATSLRRVWLAAALVCATVAAAAMAAMTAATAVYAIALALDASALSGAPNGPLGAMSTGASLIEQVVVMALAAAGASVTVRRGWRGTRRLSVSGDNRPPPVGDACP
jgi:hypothetical protein